jgi:excisionase family DNA binding protein
MIRSAESLSSDFEYLLKVNSFKNKVFLRTFEVAKLLNISERHVNRLIKEGQIKGYRTSGKSRNTPYQVFSKDVERYFIEVNTTDDFKTSLK